jgi:hypothetical protein
VLQELTKSQTIDWENGRMVKRHDFEESRRGLIEVLSRQLPGGTEESHESLNQDCRCLGEISRIRI